MTNIVAQLPRPGASGARHAQRFDGHDVAT
jgi:hypothetical protein